ncbi:MAG: transposase [Methylibium sp.]|nr:transposase [Methylibium sp.]
MVYDFCTGRAESPRWIPGGWSCTLVRDEGLRRGAEPAGPTAAGCQAHARRKFDELIKCNASPVAMEALRRIAAIYRVER